MRHWTAIAALCGLLAAVQVLASTGALRSVLSLGAPDQGTAPPTPLAPVAEGPWTLVVLPDTQFYTQDHPGILDSQTRWIADNQKARNIAFVLQEGDITNANDPDQWRNAQRSLSRLDGVVPYALVPGNHDYGDGGSTNSRRTLLNQYFPVSHFQGLATFGGVYKPGKLQNSYHLFHAGGRDWLVLALEFGPRERVVTWANEILDQYPQRQAIILTHAYLYDDGTRCDYTRAGQTWNPHDYPAANHPGGTNDGEELWRKCVSLHPNVAFVFCGHILGDGAGRLSSRGIHGNLVHQLLANYQMRPLGGEGYLRLIEFSADSATAQVETYSPCLDRSLTDPQNQFTLDPALSPAP